MGNYDHKKIEEKWQKRWEKEKLYETKDSVKGKENFYTLFEFPYPSGDLHIGHWYAFSVPDMFARMKRMQGYNVLFPIGFDAFGLPAENAAIKNKVNPRDWTDKNIDRMRSQLKSMGMSVDWSREVSTHESSYIKGTQQIFLTLHEAGLAYRGKALVNWDPVDKTVLANEQVLPDGTAERSGAVVEKKELEQWFFKITDYADRLIDDLELLNWPEPIKESQRNWIGRSEGAELDFPLEDKNVKRILILHGRGSTPETAFIPSLRKSLEARGYEVEIPQLPNAKHPDDNEQAEFVEKNCTIDEETAIVGHSFGGVVALRLLERGAKVARVTLIATPYSGTYLDGKKRDSVSAALEKGFDAAKIKKSGAGFLLLYDTNDAVVPFKDGEEYQKLLGGFLVGKKAEKSHFMNAFEPEILPLVSPSIRVFTTRPDTLYGATYLVLAPEHPWVKLALDGNHDVLKNKKEVAEYVAQARKKSELERQKQEKEKTGVRIQGIEAMNPATKEMIPLYVADYVLGHYGTGAVMAVPAHDERDHEFAKKFNLPIVEVVKGGDPNDAAYVGTGILKNSEQFDGIDNVEAKKKITEFVGGHLKKTYKLRDWLISRQRYWGAPIPIVYDPEGKPHAIPVKNLPWELPTDVDFTPTGEPPLARSKELKERTEKIFGKGWRPETDTMDGFVDNSWYFLRYLDSENTEEIASLDKQKRWMPIRRYSGGSEHTTVHVLYSRFMYKALNDIGCTTYPEPYLERLNRGIILAEDGRKMSKRWGNVVNPDEQVAIAGTDAVRAYMGFIGPYNVIGSFPWSTNGLIGTRKFLERVVALRDKVDAIPVSIELERVMNQSIKKVGEDIESMKINTSISQLMIFSNALGEEEVVPQSVYETFLTLLAPIAPHLTEELWQSLGKKDSIHLQKWPPFDPSKLEGESVTVAVQILGKTKGTVEAPRGASKSDVEALVRADKKLSLLATESPQRIIFVENKIINFIP